MKDALERMKKALDKLAEDDAPPGSESMTPEQFVTYATEQIEAAANDKPEIRKARLTHLMGQVAAVQKNFEGQVPAALPVQRFKDAAQATPTSTETNPGPQNQPTGAGNFASNEPGPASSAAGSQPPGGTNPPLTAGSGAPGPEQFAKAFSGLQKAIEALTAATPAPAAPATTPSATPPATNPAAPATTTETTTTEDVHKSVGVIWPSDMNSSFGRGLADSEDEPDWGFDSGSAADKRAKTRKNAQA